MDFWNIAAVKTQNFKHAIRSGFEKDIARKIAFAPHLNIGVFDEKIVMDGIFGRKILEKLYPKAVYLDQRD